MNKANKIYLERLRTNFGCNCVYYYSPMHSIKMKVRECQKHREQNNYSAYNFKWEGHIPNPPSFPKGGIEHDVFDEEIYTKDVNRRWNKPIDPKYIIRDNP